MLLDKILRPDAKGRICLGSISKGISGYKAIINEKTMEITLKPYAEMPFTEKWLFQNKEALESVKRGLKDSETHNVSYKGRFSQYTEDDV